MSHGLDFVLMDLKEAIKNIAGKVPELECYKFNKNELTFKRQFEGNKTIVGFDIINFYPESFEFNFAVIVWIKELTVLTTKFFDFAQLSEPAKWSTVFFEGDFMDELWDKDEKLRNHFCHVTISLAELDKSIKLTCETLRNKALPVLNKVDTLEKFQHYYLGNKAEIAKNFGKAELFISSLLAASLVSKSEFNNLAEFLLDELDIEKCKGSEYGRLYFLLDKLTDFVKRQ